MREVRGSFVLFSGEVLYWVFFVVLLEDIWFFVIEDGIKFL